VKWFYEGNLKGMKRTFFIKAKFSEQQ
jgi:hypothetical protein